MGGKEFKMSGISLVGYDGIYLWLIGCGCWSEDDIMSASELEQAKRQRQMSITDCACDIMPTSRWYYWIIWKKDLFRIERFCRFLF